MYHNGEGVKQSYEKSNEYYRRGMEKGDAECYVNLGNNLRNGLGSRQNYDEARKCFQIAIQLGNADAYSYLGIMFRDEEGVPRDLNTAQELFIIGATNGSEICAAQLAALPIVVSPAPTSFKVTSLSNRMMDHRTLKLVRVLGRGSASLVEEMEDGEGNHFAVKLLPPTDDEGERKLLIGEIETLRSIVHPCVVQLVGVFLPTAREQGSVTMELARNGSLEDLLGKLRQNTATITDAQRKIIALGIALGMRCVHAIGCIHRNLEPSNILLTEKLEPKISGFVLAQVTGSTMSGAQSHLRYMAPELTNEKGHYTNAADVYSFGMILFELYTLQTPFEGSNSTQAFMSAMRGQRPKVSEECPVKSLIEQCWSANEKHRPSFDEIATELLKGETSPVVFAFFQKVMKAEMQYGVFAK